MRKFSVNYLWYTGKVKLLISVLYYLKTDTFLEQSVLFFVSFKILFSMYGSLVNYSHIKSSISVIQ